VPSVNLAAPAATASKVPATQTAACANSDFNCKAGVGQPSGLPPIPAMTDAARNAVANAASTVSDSAGAIAAGATAVSTSTGPYGKAALPVAAAATGIAITADALEQLARPDLEKVLREQIALGLPADALAKRYPQFAPLIEMIKQGMK
jgi:hypothetical protein